MKLKLYILICISFLFLFAACEQEEEPIIPVVGSRTVLVYIVADNNGLEESFPKNFASRDIDEMMVGMKSVDTSLYNLLVYLDDKNTPVLFRIGKDSKGNVKKEIVKEYAEQVSTDVSVMTEVLHRTFYEYPADSYGLVYWSHADGWIPYPLSSGASTRWIGQDAGQGDERMNISDFLTVLDSAPHFDFIMFDACFMMSVEVAYELRNYTDYYMGCPTENPGPGAPYDMVVPQMFVTNAAKNMATEYFNYYQGIYNDGVGISNSSWTGGTSIAVLKTAELDNLATVTKQVLPDMAIDNSVLRQNVFNYDKRTSSSVGYYDMQQMMKNILDNSSYSYWKQAFDASVVYWNTTDKNYSQYIGEFSMKDTNGVSHYISKSLSSSAAAAYRSTAWYTAAGLDQIGW